MLDNRRIIRITNPDNTLRRDYSAARNETAKLSYKSRLTDNIDDLCFSVTLITSCKFLTA